MKRCYFRCRCHCWCQILRNGNNREAERLLTWTLPTQYLSQFSTKGLFAGQYKYIKHGKLVWPARDFNFVKWQAQFNSTSCHLNIEYCMPLVEHPSWKHFWRFALGLISTALERVLQVHSILLPKRLLASHWKLQIEQWQYISLATFNSSIARYSIQ